jgi:hypothetical protein
LKSFQKMAYPAGVAGFLVVPSRDEKSQ